MNFSSQTTLITSFVRAILRPANTPTKLVRVLFVLVWITSLSLLAQAQNAEFTQNTKNLNTVTLEVPLANYPGRGVNLPVTLRYSSHGLWRVGFINSVQVNQFNVRNSIAEAIYGEYSTGGWKTSLDVPVIEWPRSNDLYKYNGLPYSQGYISGTTYRIARVFVHMPDGSTHELRRSDQIYANSAVEMNGEFYAVDGSRMHYSGNSNGTGTLYLSDGSKYIFNGSTVQFIDRNGNTLSYDVANRQWTDTLGRTINMPWPANPSAGDYTYSLPGLGNSISYTLKFRSLSDVISAGSPARIPIGDHYLPYPGATPTYYGSNNFPQATNTASMFVSANSDPEEPQSPSLNTIVVGRGQAGTEAFNPVVLAEIDFPNGQSYTFTYNNFGELDKVTYPTGGYQRYSYSAVATVSGGGVAPYDEGSRGITSRWVSAKGDGTDEAQWTYSTNASPLTVTAPNGTYSQTYLWTAQTQQSNNFGYLDSRAGLPSEQRIYNSSGTMLRRTLYNYEQASASYTKPSPGSGSYTAYRNPRPTKAVSLIFDTGGDALYSMSTTSYDATYDFTVGPEATLVSEYDYGTYDSTSGQSDDVSHFSGGALVRKTATTYLTSNSNYRNRNILGVPTSVIAYDASNNVLAQSSIDYDENTLLTYGSVPGWTDPGTAYRANPTTTKLWLDFPSSTWLQTHIQFDQCGSVRKTWDANDTALINPSQIDYASTYGYAYPTTTTTAVPGDGTFASSSAFVATTVYDFNTGLVTSMTDPNGQTTTLDYTDPLNRIRKVTRPDGGWTATDYGDTAGSVYVRTRVLQKSGPDEVVDGYQYVDGLGRASRSFAYENQDTSYPWLTSDMQYDSMGRAYRVSNPYRSTGSGSAVNPSGNWSTSVYDSLGRVTSITTADGAAGTTSYVGNKVTVADQLGKARRTVSDAFGRVVRVDEPEASSGSLDDGNGNPLQPTYYTYDPLGRLRKIDQGGQNRFFMYDSVGRLVRAWYPEQTTNTNLPSATDSITSRTAWTFAYVYDNNGNVTSRTDARNITTTYGYDKLNRPTTVDYGDSTKDIERHYDNATSGKNGLGRFWYANWDNSDNTRFDTYAVVDEYDRMGRPKTYRQKYFVSGVASEAFTVTRTYDLSGHITSQTYPSGDTVNYSYDQAGRLKEFTGNLGDGFFRTYSTGVSYSQFGGLQQEKFGTATELYHKLHYNVRGQLYDIRLSTQSLTGSEWNYNRGAIVNFYGGYSAGQSGANNNGNITSQQHLVPNDDSVSDYKYTTDSFSYDKLNRLTSVSELHGTSSSQSGQDFAQIFDYDRWGNRTINSSTSSGVPHPNYTVDTNTNRLVAPSGHTYDYDAAGNQITDDYTGGGARTYNANNQLITARNLDTTSWSSYTYDFNGRRVKRVVDGVETWQLYGIDGELLAEYPANGSPAHPQKEYGYRGGQLLITAESGVALGVAPADLKETSASSSSVTLGWAANGASNYRVERKERNSSFAYLTHTGNAYYTDSVSTGAAYLYRICAADSLNNCTSSYSNIVLGVAVNFNEEVVGLSEVTNPASATTIKAEHINELRAAVNAVRYLALLDNASYTHSDPTPQVSLIYVTDVRELRTKLNEALTVLHLDTPPFTDPTLVGLSETSNPANATPVRAIHIRELRDRVKKTVGSTCYKSIDQFVKDLYQGIFQTQPTPTQLASATSTLESAQASGASSLVAAAQSMASTLFSSTDYTNLSTSDSQFITDLYVGLLQRQPDSAGHQYWLDEVQGLHDPNHIPRPRADLVTAFKTSGEFMENVKALCRTAGGGSTTGSVHWLVTDQLGSPRMVVDASGSLANMSRHDYLPFGEDMPGAFRSGIGGYGEGDGLRQKFTGYEADDRTGLNFAQARYQSADQGRFTSVDPLGASASVVDPQSLNRYSYVENNPVNATDPSGMMMYDASMGWGDVSGLWMGGGDSHFGAFENGQSIIAARMAERDQAIADTRFANALNEQIRSGDMTREEAEAAINGNDNLAIDDGGGSVSVSAAIVGVAMLEEAPEHPQDPQHSRQEGTEVQGPTDPNTNCMSHGLGYQGIWLQPGPDGHSIVINPNRPNQQILDMGRPVTPGNLPGFLGGRWIHANQSCPRGTYKTKVYEDSASAGNWHVQRKAFGSKTWTSKNGGGSSWTNIRNPDLFYRQQYFPAGHVTITAWCVPVH